MNKIKIMTIIKKITNMWKRRDRKKKEKTKECKI